MNVMEQRMNERISALELRSGRSSPARSPKTPPTPPASIWKTEQRRVNTEDLRQEHLETARKRLASVFQEGLSSVLRSNSRAQSKPAVLPSHAMTLAELKPSTPLEATADLVVPSVVESEQDVAALQGCSSPMESECNFELTLDLVKNSQEEKFDLLKVSIRNIH